MQYMTVGLKRKVSLALLPVDDLTGQIITGSMVRVYIKEENIPAIRKPDGYHVFCDLPGSEAEICLEGPLYQKQMLRLPIGQGEPKVYQVRMLPGIAYPLPPGTTVVSGVLPKGSVLRLFFTGKKRGCKLLCDYDPGMRGEELSLFRPNKMNLEGKILCIRDKEKDHEFIKVLEQKGDACILEHPLSKVYQKSDADVYPVYEAAAGEDESFYLPIGSLTGEEIGVCVLMEADGTAKTCEMVLMAGRENRLTEDLRKEES